MADKYISLDEALAILRISEDKFETLISNGELKAFRTQGKVKFKDTDVASLSSRLESINMDSVIDDDELPSINDSSEVMPAVEMESLEDSDFTIELPDEVVSGDPTASSSGLSLEDEDSLVMEVDDFGLEEKGSDTNPSDITIHEEDLDLNIEDDNFGTSDITLQDEVYGTSELTVQEDAVNTSDLTVQEDAVNTSDLTASDDGYGTEANLTVDDGEVIETDDKEEAVSRGSDRRSSRKSARTSAAPETTGLHIFFLIIASLTLVTYIWSLIYILPYHYLDTNNPLSIKKTVVPDYMSGQRDWAVETFMSEGKSGRTIDTPFTRELFSDKAAAGEVPAAVPEVK